MPIRISGLNSGLDTESLVSELVSAYRKKGEKYEKSQTKISWKQEAWKSMSAQTSAFRKSLDSVRFSSGYNLKTTSVSNSAKASVTADNNAVNGTQTLEITSLAKRAYLTGGKVKSSDGSAVTNSTTMQEMGLGDSGDISINGKRITIDGGTTVKEMIQKLQDAGLNANFDAQNQRIFVSAAESGKASDFTLTALNENGAKALSALGLNVKPDDKDMTYSQYVDAYGSMTDEELADVLFKYNTGSEDADRLIASFAKEYKAADNVTTRDAVFQEFKDFINYAKSVQNKADEKEACSQYVDAYGAMDAEGLANVLANYDTDAEDAKPLIANFAKKYKEAVDAGDADAMDAAVQEFQDFIEYARGVQNRADEEIYNTDAVRVNGEDAVIKLNGAEFTSDSNTITVNGLTINAMATTEKGEVLTITTSTNHQGIYDKIKDFLSEYNNLINAMTSSYNAESSKDYEPLTDEEKEAMSEKEIEKWEEKGKSGILRRDNTLGTLMSLMTNVMSKSYTINGKSYALSSFGIKTLGITNAEKNEHNAYHIDGDADDESTSANEDKLMAAIIADPDGVTQFFQKLSSELYDNLGTQMTSTSLRSYGSFYNDKELESQYNSYTKTISDWEKKVSDIEESYYKKFAAMESALASLQSQSSQLAGLLG